MKSHEHYVELFHAIPGFGVNDMSTWGSSVLRAMQPVHGARWWTKGSLELSYLRMMDIFIGDDDYELTNQYDDYDDYVDDDGDDDNNDDYVDCC